jgi:hypothetical protein
MASEIGRETSVLVNSGRTPLALFEGGSSFKCILTQRLAISKGAVRQYAPYVGKGLGRNGSWTGRGLGREGVLDGKGSWTGRGLGRDGVLDRKGSWTGWGLGQEGVTQLGRRSSVVGRQVSGPGKEGS